MKLLFRMLILSFIVTAFISCDKDDPTPTPNPNVSFQATLNGGAEVPPVITISSGTATLTYNSTTKIFTIVVTHNVAAPTNGHIHLGAVGVSGPVVFPFASFTSPINYTSPPLTAAQETDLMNNLYYVNIHTAANPGGEIRGQLIKQ